MLLRDFCTDLFFPTRLTIRHKQTKKLYLLAVQNLGEFLGRDALVVDLCAENLIGMMRMMVDQGLAARTANNRRTNLCAIWDYLYREGFLRRGPNVGMFPEPQRIPRAWNAEQLGQLIDACRRYRKKICGIAGPDWWLAFHGIAWDTGERTRSILALCWDWYDRSTRILHVPADPRKASAKDALYRLAPDTAGAVEKVRAQTADARILPHGSISGFYRRYGTLLRSAGLPCDRYSKPQRIRRSHASHLKAAGGDPTASLLHSCDAVTRRAYLDPSICGDRPAELLFRIL